MRTETYWHEAINIIFLLLTLPLLIQISGIDEKFPADSLSPLVISRQHEMKGMSILDS